MRIAPRTLLCASTWQAAVGGIAADADASFNELRQLTTVAGDRVSLAIGMAGYVMALSWLDRYREHDAFSWHMRAGTWLTNRSISAAQTSWHKARQIADRLPDDDPDRMTMRIAPRTLLCGSAWRVGGSGADPGFDELRGLCETAGDKRSLAIGIAGAVVMQFTKTERRAAPVSLPNSWNFSNRSTTRR